VIVLGAEGNITNGSRDSKETANIECLSGKAEISVSGAAGEIIIDTVVFK
jgi:hypothetical protein